MKGPVVKTGPKKITSLLNNPSVKVPVKLIALGKKVGHVTSKIFNIFAVVFCIVAVASIGYHVYFAKRVIPGVKVGNVNIGGMTYSEAKSTLENKEKSLNKVLQFKNNTRTYDINPEDIDLTYDWDATLSRVFEIGRTKNLFVDTKDKLAGLIKPLNISALYDYNDEMLSTKLSSITGEINIEPQNSYFTLNNGKLEISNYYDGQVVDSEELYKLLVSTFGNLDFTPKLVPIEKASSKITRDDLKTIEPVVQAIINNNFKVTYGDKSWDLKQEQVLDLLAVKKTDNVVEPMLSKSKFESYLETLAQLINEPPRGQVTKTEDDKVTEFELIKEGKELDAKKFTEDFRQALFTLKPSVEVPTITISGPADTNKYGLVALLGTGVSKYTGSASGRIHNLSLAAERTNGVLVPPGGIYSFNNSVGDISLKNGYDTAFIIRNGRTVLGEGGGVCQTSTTLFRAVLNAGLPIVARSPHAYRVHYYELGSPVGFDASVFQPSLDFQFKNDTPSYILVQSSVDKSQYSLEFKIYGTPDGREVEISEPVVSNITPPPEPLYEDDPTLPKDTVKQVDFAAWGANVSFNRVVKRDGQELFKDTFSSRYQPWRAVYLKGTKK